MRVAKNYFFTVHEQKNIPYGKHLFLSRVPQYKFIKQAIPNRISGNGVRDGDSGAEPSAVEESSVE